MENHDVTLPDCGRDSLGERAIQQAHVNAQEPVAYQAAILIERTCFYLR